LGHKKSPDYKESSVGSFGPVWAKAVRASVVVAIVPAETLNKSRLVNFMAPTPFKA